MDGHWTVDGLGLVVSDSAGQMHFYGTGNADMYARSALLLADHTASCTCKVPGSQSTALLSMQMLSV